MSDAFCVSTSWKILAHKQGPDVRTECRLQALCCLTLKDQGPRFQSFITEDTNNDVYSLEGFPLNAKRYASESTLVSFICEDEQVDYDAYDNPRLLMHSGDLHQSATAHEESESCNVNSEPGKEKLGREHSERVAECPDRGKINNESGKFWNHIEQGETRIKVAIRRSNSASRIETRNHLYANMPRKHVVVSCSDLLDSDGYLYMTPKLQCKNPRLAAAASNVYTVPAMYTKPSPSVYQELAQCWQPIVVQKD